LVEKQEEDKVFMPICKGEQCEQTNNNYGGRALEQQVIYNTNPYLSLSYVPLLPP
jgi:hypothetical protein